MVASKKIRGLEGTTFLRAGNTGHPGSLSTVHADALSRTINQLALLILQTGRRISWADIERYVHRSIDIVVQPIRTHGRRQVEEIVELG